MMNSLESRFPGPTSTVRGFEKMSGRTSREALRSRQREPATADEEDSIL